MRGDICTLSSTLYESFFTCNIFFIYCFDSFFCFVLFFQFHNQNHVEDAEKLEESRQRLSSDLRVSSPKLSKRNSGQLQQ